MDGMAGTKSSLQWAVHISVLFLVALWLFPTIGLFVSSFRTADQITGSGWWSSLSAAEQNETLRAADPDDEGVQVQEDGTFFIRGNLYDEGSQADIKVWGTSSREIGIYQPGDTADLGDGETITVQANGDYVQSSPTEMSGRGQRVFVTASNPPEFTTDF